MSQLMTSQLLHEKDQKIAQLEQALAVEAALESVRSQTMRMQKSEELPEVALTFFNQIEQLGIPINGATINIVNEEKKTYQLYFATNNKIGISSELSIDDFWFAKESYRQLKKGKNEFTITCKGKKLQALIDFNKKEILKKGNSAEKDLRLNSSKLEKYYSHSVQFHGLSHSIFSGIKPLSEETHYLVSVFQLSSNNEIK